MSKKPNYKDLRSYSRINYKENNNSKNNNISRVKMSKRKNKSELKLYTFYFDNYLPKLNDDSHIDENPKSRKFHVEQRKGFNTIGRGFYNTRSSNELQKTLSLNKNRMIKNKTEINELKIQYNKLSAYNEKNRRVLAKILNIKSNRPYTTEEILKTMEKNNLDKTVKRKMKKMFDSTNLMELELKLNEKKTIIKHKNNEYMFLKENAKCKNVSDIKNDLSEKDDMKKQVELDIEKLKEIIIGNTKFLEMNEEQYKKLDEKYKEIKKEEDDIISKSNECKKNITIVQDIISKCERKLQRQEILYKQNFRNQYEISNSIEEKEKQIKELNEYISKREEINCNVQNRKNLIKTFDNRNRELDNEYERLNNENNILMKKNNEMEKNKKLQKKMNVSKKEGNKIKIYEENLKKLKKEFQSMKSEHEIQQKKYKEMNKKKCEIIQKNKEEIDKRNKLINDLEKKKNELELNLKNWRKNIDDLQAELDNRKKQVELLKDKIRENENNVNEEELENENEKLILENNNLKEEIEKINKELEKYNDNENDNK